MTWALAGAFLKRNWANVGLAAALALCLLLAFCMGGGREREKQAGRTIKQQQKVGQANENAAGARVTDAVRIEREKQELDDAIANSTDADDARRRAGCVILRQQGRDTSAIPACR